jgi:hypothetical protein
MDYKVFEGRVLELLFKTDDRLTSQLVAYRVGIPVEEARTMLETMATHEIVTMEPDDSGGIYFDLPNRPPPTRQPLSWQMPQLAAPAYPQPYAPYPPPMMMVPVYRPMMPVPYIPQEKSVGGAIALSFFFGPLGMLYSTVPGALTMFFAGLMFTIMTFGFGILLVWPACMVWSAIAANTHNDRVRGQTTYLQTQHHLQMQQQMQMQMQQQLLAQRSVPPKR